MPGETLKCKYFLYIYRDGAGLIVQLLADDKNIIGSIKAEIMKQVSDLNTPL